MTGQNDRQVVVFGGGCFWCTEAVFKMLKGVVSVRPGYAGGTKEDPTYEEVSTGETGYAEVVEVVYKPATISYNDLLTVFFGSHDPTTLNRQGPDTGTQYRSAIFYTTPEQENETKAFIRSINKLNFVSMPIVTIVEPLAKFYPAEGYHEDYFANHPHARYCELIIEPKIKKVRARFTKLLKESR